MAVVYFTIAWEKVSFGETVSKYHYYRRKLLIVIGVLVLGVGCHHKSDNTDLRALSQQDVSQESITHATLANNSQQPTNVTPISTISIRIDWTKVETGITPIDPAKYPYPFTVDSEPVQNYARAYDITPSEAQHSMMLAMAAPEALGKVLDQIQGHYLGHYLTDGKQMSLVIETTDKVVSGRYDYVFADKFGEGLVLPIVIAVKAGQ